MNIETVNICYRD